MRFMLKDEHLKIIGAVVANNIRLATTFPARRFNGEAILFMAADGAEPPVNSWSGFMAGRLAIHSIDSIHERMMDPWPASEIGRVLASKLSLQENDLPREAKN